MPLTSEDGSVAILGSPRSAAALTPLGAQAELSEEALRLATNSADLKEFSEKLGAAEDINRGVDLALHYFPNCRMTISRGHDPSESGEWLTIDVFSAESSDVVEAAYEAFTRDWIRRTDDDKLLLIRLITNLV